MSPCYLQQFIPCNRLAASITCCSWYVKGSRGYQSRLHFNPVAGPDHLNAGIVLRLVGRSPRGALQSSRSPNRFLFVFFGLPPATKLSFPPDADDGLVQSAFPGRSDRDRQLPPKTDLQLHRYCTGSRGKSGQQRKQKQSEVIYRVLRTKGERL